MQVFAIEIDGVLADRNGAFWSYLAAQYDDIAFDFTKSSWHQRIGKPAYELIYHEQNFLKEDQLWAEFRSFSENIEEISGWVFAGMVPSIICKRPVGRRIMTELWLAQNYAPYSNLIFAEHVDDIPVGCRLIDADFFVTTNTYHAHVANVHKTQQVYILRDIYNKNALWGIEETGIRVVDSLHEVAEQEGIRSVSGAQ